MCAYVSTFTKVAVEGVNNALQLYMLLWSQNNIIVQRMHDDIQSTYSYSCACIAMQHLAAMPNLSLDETGNKECL